MLAFGIEFALAALLLGFAFTWRRVEPLVRRLSSRTVWCMVLLAILPVALRLALLFHHPAPRPDVYDEFSHLLVAGTLRHFRLANPPLPMPQFFETFFVVQEPAYASIYPIGQGLVLAMGGALFGHPWAGVILATAAFCGLCCWMLRGWVTPMWALAGGVLAVVEFGPLCAWMNTYWGGALGAAAGCLVFGALPRLRASRRTRDAVLLGAGLGVHVLTRPYESVYLAIAAVLFFLPRPWRFWRAGAIAAAVALPALGITALQNKQVTGSWITLPYTLSQYQYGVPASLIIQANVEPHRELTPQQALDYRMQRAFHGEGGETLASFFGRLEYRVRFYRFFFLAPLYLALPAFLASLRQWRYVWVAGTLALFALGVNLFPAFQVHYVAACTCLFVLVGVVGLEQLCRLKAGREAAWIIVLLCGGQFLFWYGVHIADTADAPSPATQYETWQTLDHGNVRRMAVDRALAQASGRQVVFVRYSPRHIFQEEWVWNEADPGSARVIWARDLGMDEDRRLLALYPGRTAWLLEPDIEPVRLAPFLR
ncbi:MAG TPA: hypothetical protein VMJ34_16840 [Bryobacteraceae bacterium]|nr:hypothetical protein [Bryobacteraceae bacterium]